MSLIVVSGAIANKLHQGGEAGVRLSYVLGLRRLGYSVFFLEQISGDACVDAAGQPCEFQHSENLAYFNRLTSEIGLADCAALIPVPPNEEVQLNSELIDIADAADALLNISGHLSIEPLLLRFRKRVLIDIDPGYTQYWHIDGLLGPQFSRHDWFFTIGENLGNAICPIPTDGIDWIPTRPPVVLDMWPVVATNKEFRFTTIANWRGAFGSVRFGGKTFGLKAHEFRKVVQLPHTVSSTFELALNIHPADHHDKTSLEQNGWRLLDARAKSDTSEKYRQYIQDSSAEFSVAQGIYVETNSGWFSDRTTRYLASGKPALVQDTGFSRYLPASCGLVAFQSLQEAIAGAENIVGDYSRHCQAARAIAEEFFDSDKVLNQLMRKIGVEP